MSNSNDGIAEYPLSGTLKYGRVTSHNQVRRVVEDQDIRSVIEEDIRIKNSVPMEAQAVSRDSNSVQNCKSLAEHRAGCKICSGSSVLSFVGKTENYRLETHHTSEKTANHEDQSRTEKSLPHRAVLHPFYQSFAFDSQIPSQMKYELERSISSISEAGACSKGLSTILENREQRMLIESNQKRDQIGSFEEPLRNTDSDTIKLNDSSYNFDYQFYNGFQQKLSSSFRGNGFNNPNQIHLDYNPSLSSAVTYTNQKHIWNTFPVSVAQSTFTGISAATSRLNFNFEQTPCQVPFTRCNLQNWKTNQPIQAESTPKASSEIEPDSELSYSNKAIESHEAVDEYGNYSWLENHRQRCNVCKAYGKADAAADNTATVISTGTAKQLFSCGTCGKAFGRKDRLARHLIGHQGLKVFPCTTCNKHFAQSSHLLIHENTAHHGKKDQVCATCGKSFGYRSHLERHEKTVHQGEKNHLCSTCGKAFGHKYHLQLHVSIVHEGKKDHTCSTCRKAFGRLRDLQVHIRTVHEGKKDYTCSTCGVAFGHKNHLTVHMRIHDGTKPFVCSKCQKPFTQKNNLTVHMRIHEKEKAFACSSCDKRYAKKVSLKIHKRNVHYEEIDGDFDRFRINLRPIS